MVSDALGFMQEGGWPMWVQLALFLLGLPLGVVALIARLRLLTGVVAVMAALIFQVGYLGWLHGLAQVDAAVVHAAPDVRVELRELGAREAGRNLQLSRPLSAVLAVLCVAAEVRALRRARARDPGARRG